MQTITLNQLEKIVKTISLYTLKIYLSNYKFYKYEERKPYERDAKYRVDGGFLNLLYTTLYYRRKIKEANRIKTTFKDYKIELIRLDN
jgi:hypothetical protein